MLPSSHSKSGKSESKVKVKREPVLSKRKLENSTTRWQKIEEETETYGLNRIKRKKGSNEKKKKMTIMSQTETIRKKIKEKDSIPRQSPQTPKPEYINHCLSIH
jgi:translation elongation factor P/translation initiation factor 5A